MGHWKQPDCKTSGR